MEENPYAATAAASDRDRPATKKHTIKRFDPLQVGKVLGILYALMGLIFAPIMLIVGLSGGSARGAGVGVGMAVMMPVMYGVMGFIGGIIAAWLYNLCAKFVGGIQVEVE
jgi:hypothetical protein